MTRYSRTGGAEVLPELNVARAFHACGAFLNEDGATVSFSYLIVIFIKIMIIMKVILVTGGSNAVNADLDSTEILVTGAWEMNTPLPYPL